MKALLSVLAVTALLMTALPAMADDSAPQISPNHVVTQEEYQALEQSLKPYLPKPPPATSPADYVFYCAAQSYATGLWYYWYSWSLPYAQYQALGACQVVNGFTCTVACY